MVRDLGYIQKHKYRVIMAVDVYDLIEYCFPINPTTRRQPIDPDDLAETQAGLSYLFSPESDERPAVLLTPEYLNEFRRVIRAIERNSPSVHDKVEMIDAVIKAGNLQNISEQQKKDIEEVVKNSFQFLLAVMLNLHSTGVDRMRSLLDTVLLTSPLSAVHSDDRILIERIWQGYQRKHFNKILKILQQENNQSDNRKKKSLQGLQDDAQAIDRLIYMNQEVELVRDRLKQRYLFLYVSSAFRSERLFAHKEIRDILPQVGNRKSFNFLRNRRQILAYVIYRSRSKKKLAERAGETINELRKLSRLSCTLKEVRPLLEGKAHRCHNCALDLKTPTRCDNKNACLEIAANAKQLNQKQKEIINLNFYLEVSNYQHLLEADISEEFPAADSFKGYMDLFASVLKDSRLRNIALRRMHERHMWITRWSKWMGSRHPALDASAEDLRSEMDAVRGIDQYLPTQPRFKSAECKQIMELILAFFRQPRRKELVDEVFDKFHTVDPEKIGDEYDLLQSYFYLVFRFEGERIHDEICKLLLPKKEQAEKRMWQECLYLLCWSARRFGLFDDSERFASEGRSSFPDDPRLHHGWALSVFAKHLKNEHSMHSVDDAVEASERALELYKAAKNKEQIAATHNNIAYMLAYSVKHSDVRDHEHSLEKLIKARQHVDDLKKVTGINDVPGKDTQWADHPEYFHTEAFLEFQEAYKNFTGMDFKVLKKKLDSAKRDSRKALELFECKRYKELKDEISDFYLKVMPAHHR